MQQPIRLIDLPAVLATTCLSKTGVYTILDFPKPIKIKGAGATAQGGARWVESEVQAWIQSRIKIRDTQPRPVCPGLARGRPTKTESVEARSRGISVRELRASQIGELDGGAA